MKSYIFLIMVFLLNFSGITYADDMDGQPEVAPPAGQLIGSGPEVQEQCKILKEQWKIQYKEVQTLDKSNETEADQKQLKLDNTTNSLMSLGCVESTDKLEQEVDDEMK